MPPDLLRAVEALAATTATVGHQSHDPHNAIQKALWHGAAHIHPTAHRTARALPALALSRGVFHALLSVTSRTNGRRPWPLLREPDGVGMGIDGRGKRPASERRDGRPRGWQRFRVAPGGKSSLADMADLQVCAGPPGPAPCAEETDSSRVLPH
jgi:hypothetical protein